MSIKHLCNITTSVHKMYVSMNNLLGRFFLCNWAYSATVNFRDTWYDAFFAIIERNLITLDKKTSGVHICIYMFVKQWNTNVKCLNMGLWKNQHDMHFVLHTIIIFELVWSDTCVGENLNYTLPRANISHLLGRVLNKERIIFRLFQGGYTFWWTDMALAIPQLSKRRTSSLMARFPASHVCSQGV